MKITEIFPIFRLFKTSPDGRKVKDQKPKKSDQPKDKKDQPNQPKRIDIWV